METERKNREIRDILDAITECLHDYQTHIVTIDGVDYEVSAVGERNYMRMYICNERDILVWTRVRYENISKASLELATMAVTYFELEKKFSKDKGE